MCDGLSKGSAYRCWKLNGHSLLELSSYIFHTDISCQKNVFTILGKYEVPVIPPVDESKFVSLADIFSSLQDQS